MKDKTDNPPLSQDPDINPQAGAVSDEVPVEGDKESKKSESKKSK